MDLEKMIKRSALFRKYDHRIIAYMKRHGENVELYLLGAYFSWFGLLKIFGGKSASSIIAKSIYWFDPNIMVPFLGVWEALIGICLFIPKVHRLAILLLVLRAPGVFLALVYHYDECFIGSIFQPSIQGQYLIKQLTLVGAALVIGSTIKPEKRIENEVHNR